MSEKPRLSNKTTQVLLALREGARSWPLKVRRELSDVPRQTVEYQIKRLEEEGIVTGYTPIVIPEAFGDSYLISIPINPKDYQFRNDAETKIDAISKFFEEAINSAPISFFVLSENGFLQVQCVMVSTDVQGLVDRLSVKLSIAKEDISVSQLERVRGIPGYGRLSILQEGQEIDGH